MKRVVRLGMNHGDLWLALAGQELPANARLIERKQAAFWLRKSVPPMAHPEILHAVSDIAEAVGYPFHGAMPFDDMSWVMDSLESAIKDGRLIAFHAADVEGGGKGPAPQPQPQPQPKPQPTPVNPVIEPATLVVVVKKLAKNPKSGNQEPYTKPGRQPLTLKTDAAFDGTATFSCDKPDKVKFFSAAKDGVEIKFDGTANVFKPKAAPPWAPNGATISSGVTIYAEAVAPSGALDDITAKLALSGGSKPTGPEDKATITSVEVTLDIHKSRPSAGAAPPAFSKDDKVHAGRNLLVQNAAGAFERAQLVIQKVKPATFKGTLVLKARNGSVDAFKLEDPKTAGQSSALPFEIAADKIPGAGEILWAQGKAASADMRDSGFDLGIKDVDDEGDKVTATAVEIKLDICQTRTVAQATATPKQDPSPMSAADKVAVGRFVHQQDAGNHHGRALLVVRKVKPEKFDGTLVLEGITVKTELFPNERPTGGESATAVPHEIDYKTAKNEDKKLWVQGKTVSGALRDTGYSLQIKGDPKTNADKALLTVVKLKKLKADIPSTPPVTARAGNAAARHTKEITGGSQDHWDFDDATNQALVLVEDSVRAGSPINLTVEIEPAVASAHLSWDAPRDIRPAPDGDHASVRALSGRPTITRNAADRLKATLLANGVGTFHIAPFIDCNGSNQFEPTADLEPYLTMNLVLVRVEGVRNDSVAQPANAAPVPAAPTAATGCRVTTGGWAIATTGAYSKATAKVIGGGNDGRRGLDRVFAGWCQHIAATGTSASAPQGLDIFGQYRHQPPAVGPNPPPPPVLHRQFFIFTQSVPAAGGAFGPPPAAAPVVEACPVLDVTPTGTDGRGGDSCTGQWGGHGSFTPIAPVNKAIGQEWTVDTLDSPSVGLGAAHPFFPGSMVAFRFNIDFRVDLVFWTNITGVSTPTGDPADNLYSSVQTNTWTVRFGINFDPTTGNPVGAVPAVGLVMNKDGNPTRRATPLDGMGLESRAPLALNLFRRDATA